LSAESSAEPGRWVTSRAEYQREMMDVVTDPNVEDVVIMSSSQVGKTEIINNIAAFFIQQDPSPILLVQPTVEMAQAWSKDRLTPMLRDTPILHGLVSAPRSKQSANTLLHKVFPGGHITMAGANAPAGLASRPIRVVLFDEVDRYPVSAGAEGDPVKLGEKRSTTFWNRKKIKVSTPTEDGLSRIDRLFKNSDQRYYHVPCYHCGHEQRLYWRQVKWVQTPEGDHDVASAGYCCSSCGAVWSESERLWSIKRGSWVKSNPDSPTAGFHISELYSPWSSIRSIVTAFLESKDDPELLKTWTNTVLGEAWELRGEKVDRHALYERREDYEGVPEQGLILTAGVDVQHDRIEYEVVAWGEGEQSWNVDYRILFGDTAGDDIWDELDDALDEHYTHESGAEMHINAIMVDSGDRTQRVYDYVLATRHAKLFAGKGVAGAGRPVAKLSRKPKGKSRRAVDLYQIGVDDAKATLYARLKMERVGPGYCHFPMDRDLEYFEQLTAEKRVKRMVKGYEVAEWQKVRPRNEALDCRVYAYAALKVLNPTWQTAERRLGKKPARKVMNKRPPDQAVRPARRKKASRGFGKSDWGGRL